MTVYALWSAPRSRSTAFLRSMVERGDLIILHEPFFDIHAFGETDVDGVHVASTEGLLVELCRRVPGDDLFFKETTDHRYEPVLGDRRFLVEARHTFLIRRPQEIAASYYALHPDMKRAEIGLENLDDLHQAVADAGGHQPIVIDSDDLVERPAAVMAAYCEAVDLPFLPEAMSWTPQDRPEWQRTARWHRTAASSSGFESVTHRYEHTVENSQRLAAFADHHQPSYDSLRAKRLRVDAPGK